MAGKELANSISFRRHAASRADRVRGGVLHHGLAPQVRWDIFYQFVGGWSRGRQGSRTRSSCDRSPGSESQEHPRAHRLPEGQMTTAARPPLWIWKRPPRSLMEERS